MYERSRLQMEERERKLKALQEKLMSDYTFEPAARSVSSLGSSRGGDMSLVFDRLYSTDTAAIRAYKSSPRGPPAMNSPYRTPGKVKTTKDGYVTPSRLDALHNEGQTKLRSLRMTQKVCTKAWIIPSLVGNRISLLANSRRKTKLEGYVKNRLNWPDVHSHHKPSGPWRRNDEDGNELKRKGRLAKGDARQRQRSRYVRSYTLFSSMYFAKYSNMIDFFLD